MKKIIITTIALLGIFALHAQTIDIEIVNEPGLNPGKQRVIVKGIAVGDFQSSNGTDDWLTGSRITLRMSKSGHYPTIGMTAPDGSPSLTGFIGNSFFTNHPFEASYIGGEDIVTDALGFGQPDDGYVYILWNLPDVNNNFPIANGDTITLLSFDFPETWNCSECVEVVIDNPGWAIATSQSVETFLFNAGTGTNVIGENIINGSLFNGSNTSLEDDFAGEELISIYPNPAVSNGLITLDMVNLKHQDYSVKIISIEGKIIHQEKVSVRSALESIKISTQHFAKGMYEVVLTNANDRFIEKLIIN